MQRSNEEIVSIAQNDKIEYMMIKKENEQFILEIQRLREGNADPLPQNDTIDFNSTFYRKKESDIAPVEFRGKTDDVKRIKR